MDFDYADGGGRVGIIASVSRPFCHHCNRLRLTADGKLRNCLFALDETDVKGLLRAATPDASARGRDPPVGVGEVGGARDQHGEVREARPDHARDRRVTAVTARELPMNPRDETTTSSRSTSPGDAEPIIRELRTKWSVSRRRSISSPRRASERTGEIAELRIRLAELEEPVRSDRDAVPPGPEALGVDRGGNLRHRGWASGMSWLMRP